jgi:hypothetical protein
LSTHANFPSAADSGVVPFHFIENGTPGRRWRIPTRQARPGPLDRLGRRGAAAPAVRHVVRKFIASEDIKNARDVIGYRIEVVQSWTRKSSGSPNALAAIRLAQWAPPSSRGPGGRVRVGRCVGVPPEGAGGLSDRAECNPKIADMVKLFEGLAAPQQSWESQGRE